MTEHNASFGGFITDGAVRPELRGGTIRSYNPQTELYKVAVDGKGDINSIRAMKFGANKPYRRNIRVLCVRLRTIQWVIIGEVPEFVHPTETAKSPGDAIADKDKKSRGAVGDKLQIFAASAKKAGEETHYEGDTILDNAKGSFIKILESGDIWGLASYFCFFLFSAVKQLVYFKARDAIFDFAGFLFHAETDESTKRATATLDVTGDQQQEADPDISVRTGYLGGRSLFSSESGMTPSHVPGLTLTELNVAGGIGIVSTADVLLPSGSASVSDTVASSTGSPSAEKDGRVLWGLFGGHTLLEVDNTLEEVRLSRAAATRVRGVARNAETETKQLRMNKQELSLRWKDCWVSVNDSRASVSYGDNYLSVDDKKASMVFGDSFIVVNENGVQIKGFLELVGGKIRLVDEIAGAFILPDAGGVQKGAMANINFTNLPLPLLDLMMNMTVTKRSLVTELFLPVYDNDMDYLKKHSHPLDPTKTTALPDPGLAANLDQPTAVSQKPALTSNVI